jgi:branched-chain amino acid transport system ATP-binding protein
MSIEISQTNFEEETSRNTTQILRVENLTKRFGGLTAVNEVSFSVAEGEILGFIGPNGAGKSTTFNCIVGTHAPTSGTVRFKGEDITGASVHEVVQRGLARTFQTSRPLTDRDVLANVAFPLHSRATQTAKEICHRVGLGDVMYKMPTQLSHADLIRLEIGRALATDPDFILVDEPFAGLSPTEVESLSSVITELRDRGMSFVVVDHNMRGLLTLIDRAIVINNGEKIAEGAPDRIKKDPVVQEAYIGKKGISSNREPKQVDTTETELDVSSLSVSYGQANALRDIDLTVNQGELVALIGPNGAGKTTFANAVSGFLPYSGSITYHGEEVSEVRQTALVERGLVHCTEKRDLFEHMDVEDNLRLGASAHGQAAVDERLAFVYNIFPRLEERTTQTARTMSGGEQQMLAIGRALMGDPELLVLDEPTLGLAPVILQDISDALDTIQDKGVTVLLTEQNVTFALEHANRVHLLENGEIVHQGTPEEFENVDYIQDTYLGE